MNITDVAHFVSLPKMPAKAGATGRSRSVAMPTPLSAKLRSMKAVSPATFTHLRPAPVRPPVTAASQDARSFALRVLGATAKQRGERFDRRDLMSGPEQNTTFATGDDILAAARKAGVIR